MSFLAMPLLVTNLGCEMLYILEQRLKAQNIAKEKSCKVLHDVAKTMFDREWVDSSLFVPQEMYTVASTKKIFNKLVHSSIMRLSESSMDKLFDLMLMGFKYQLLSSTDVREILQVSKNHLQSVAEFLVGQENEDVRELLLNVEIKLDQMYSHLSLGQSHLLRQTLCWFFQDRRIKVSLFLAEGIQTTAGRVVMASPHAAGVGSVRYYNMNEGLEHCERLPLGSQKVSREEFFCHPVPLGCNLYNKDRPKVVPPSRSTGLAPSPSLRYQESAPSDMPSSQRIMYAEEVLEQSSSSKSGNQELNLLAALMNIPQKKGEKIKLNLFGDGEGRGGAEGLIPSHGAAKVASVSLGQEGRNERYRQAGGLADVMKQMHIEAAAPAAPNMGEGDDLLDLMDGLS